MVEMQFTGCSTSTFFKFQVLFINGTLPVSFTKLDSKS